MNTLSYGDMAQHTMLRRQNSVLKTEMSRLTQELSSGRVSDVAKHLGEDYGYLTEVERSLRVNQAFKVSASEAALFTGAMQSALEFVGDAMGEMLNATSGLIAASNSVLGTTKEIVSEDARSQMSLMVNALNTNVAGRSIFAGVGTDGAAMMSAEDMLADLRTALTGQTTLAGVEAVFNAWFDAPGGGFETMAYQGANQSLDPFLLGDGERVALDIRADDESLRATLKATAMAALATDDTLGFSDDVQSGMLSVAGTTMLGAQDEVTGLRAKLGFSEARIDEASVRLASEQTSLEYTRGELLGVDLYEVATRMEETQFRLESLYTATVRLSQLSLMGYMR